MLPLRLTLSLLLFSIGGTTDSLAQIDIGIGGISVGVGSGGDGGISVGTGGEGGISVGVGGDNGINVEVGSGGVGVGLGGSNANIGGGTSGGSGTGAEPAEIVLTQAQTLDAVRKKRAVPLAPIVASIKQDNVEVIDAELLAVRGILVYQIRIIGESGSVRELYFYARTGRQVTAD